MLIRLTAAAVIEQHGQYLLVAERAQGRIVLNTPSGRFDATDKSLAETAVREAAEEAGVIFVPEFHLGSYVTMHTAPSGQRVCTARFAFGGSVVTGVPDIARDTSILATHWLTFDEVLAQRGRHRSSTVMRCIEDYRAGCRYPLSVVNQVDDDAQSTGERH